jgi:hypothetical protein
MAIATQTLLSLVQNMAENGGDFLSFSTTTNITTNNSIISTTLKQYDSATDGFFDGRWVYLNTTANTSVLRRTGLQAGTTTYATSTGTLTVAGAALAAESGTATCYLFKFNRSHYVNALVEACKVAYPYLHKNVDNQTLITGNILPDGHFEEWTSTSALTHYSTSNATLAKTSTVTLIRGGTYSAKVTATAANGCFYIDSGMYPRLLDLKGKTVDFYTWAISEVTDDAWIKIETYSIDGTTSQSLTSTTPCVASIPTLLKLESQTLNENLYRISISWGVTTNAKYVYWDDAYLSGMSLDEYLLPSGFVTGHVSQLEIQTTGNMDEIFYDLHCFNQNKGYEVPIYTISDGSNIWLKTPSNLPTERRMRLLGISPLETMSADTDTITLSSEKVPLLIAKARMIFWSREANYGSIQDNTRYATEAYKAQQDFSTLYGVHKMTLPHELGRV